MIRPAVRSAWDAVIVGAGPAGSATAKLLAERGWRVLVVDRAEFPRTKACGESVNPGAVRELQGLGLLDAVEALPHRRIEGWRIHPSIGGAFEGHFPAGTTAIGVDRGLFDAALLDAARAAGARVRTGVHVIDLARTRGRVSGVVTRGAGDETARIVVGADGLRSVVMRRLGLLKRRPRLRKIGLTAHVEGAVVDPSAGELHLTPWGCVGLVEIAPGTANVVIVLDSEVKSRLGSGPGRAFDAALTEVFPLRESRRISEVRVTGPFDCPTHDVIADGALLVGDAAGYYDPFTGQGIYRALRGARLAADSIDHALRGGVASRESLSGYSRAHRRSFGPGERVQRLIEAAVSRPSLMAAAALALGGIPSLANRLVAVAGDLRPHSSAGLENRHGSR
ncbi:MAG TPA: NAD(P)/FAD-dependent oxidoreductase [Longimicrobiaceae bacterium]|nr:NAD(P)/FAD-dependent oxidoreductase [Longimicrobiaceae bacterium]